MYLLQSTGALQYRSTSKMTKYLGTSKYKIKICFEVRVYIAIALVGTSSTVLQY